MFALGVTLLALIPLLTAIGIILLDVARPPRQRTTLALGSMVISSAVGLSGLGMGEALMDGQWPFERLMPVVLLPVVVVIVMMRAEFAGTT